MKYFIFLMAVISTLQPVFAQTDCDAWLTPECEIELLNFAQEVIENANCQQWKIRCDLEATIYREGKVSIGTDKVVPGFSLVVAEGIIARRFKICADANSWCDYVFDKDYNLLSLEEVEQHIKENGHLHNTPSGKTIELEGGFEIGDVALDHQEKIEEIFLHLIDLKKETDALEARLKALKEENKRLRQLQLMKEMLQKNFLILNSM